jgi:hypothetical protein
MYNFEARLPGYSFFSCTITLYYPPSEDGVQPLSLVTTADTVARQVDLVAASGKSIIVES